MADNLLTLLGIVNYDSNLGSCSASSLGSIESLSSTEENSDLDLSQMGAGDCPFAPHCDEQEAIAAMIAAEFDTPFYLECDPDLDLKGRSALQHYIAFGWSQGRDPARYFSSAFYLQTYPEVLDAQINPFYHFIAFGREEGRLGCAQDRESSRPSPAMMDLTRPWLDEDFYTSTYPEVQHSSLTALEHYLSIGWLLGLDPSPGFSTSYYLASHPDVVAAGLNPLFHFVKFGLLEARAPKEPPVGEPLPANETGPPLDEALFPEDPIERELHEMCAQFDAGYYLLHNEDVAAAGVDPLQHFARTGWKEGRDPNATFSTLFYLNAYQDVAEAGVNPFWHYIMFGRHESRQIRPDPAELVAQGQLDIVRDNFDAEFYLNKNEDVRGAGVDALMHFVENGWKEGRDPSSEFSTSFYLQSNPDVADSGLNPFWHYLVAGKAEGRLPQHPGGYKVAMLAVAVPLETEVRAIRAETPRPKLLKPADLQAAILPEYAGKAPVLNLSFGHDHYRTVSGGVQLCIQREEMIATNQGEIYLNLFPYQHLPRMEKEAGTEAYLVSLIRNGQDLGVCRMSDLIAAVKKIVPRTAACRVILHQLLGHRLESVAALIRAGQSDQCWLWLHDYFTICPSYTLQRNAVSYCGAPDLGSNACTLCRFGPERADQSARFNRFFSDMDVHVLAPSNAAKDLWLARSGLKAASVTVLAHIALSVADRKKPLQLNQGGAVRVAFLGTPAAHKGWPVFERLAKRLASGSGFSFHYFGTSAPGVSGITHVPVHVTMEDPLAMSRALAEHKIDLVLHWASWPETFSLSTFESFAGQAFVLTNPTSGNVADAVTEFERGAVLNDIPDLIAFFDDGRAADMAALVRRKRAGQDLTSTMSRMSYEILGSQGAAK